MCIYIYLIDGSFWKSLHASSIVFSLHKMSTTIIQAVFTHKRFDSYVFIVT